MADPVFAFRLGCLTTAGLGFSASEHANRWHTLSKKHANERIVKSLLSVGLVMMLGCASQLVGPSFERFEFNKTPSPSDYPDAAGVTLLNRGTLTFTYDPEKRVPVARLRR